MIQRGLWLAIYFGVLIWSGIAPKPGLTWLLEWGVALALGDAAVAFLATQGAPLGYTFRYRLCAIGCAARAAVVTQMA